MALSSDVNIDRYVDQQLRTYAVKAGEVIYRGALVGLDRSSGFVRPLQPTDQFQGLSYEHCDNSSGADGGREVILFTQGDFEFELAGADYTYIGRPIFATDDNTLTLYGANASYIGRIIGVPVAGKVIVRIDPQHRLTNTITVPLSSLPGEDTKNPVGVFSTDIVIVAVRVWFEELPDSGTLDLGWDDNDPDEIVDNFNLTTLSPHQAMSLPLVSRFVSAASRIWAKVSAAGSAGGVGGGLSLEFCYV